MECRSKNKSFFLPLLRQTEALTLFSPLLSLLSPLTVSSLRTLSLSRRPIEYSRISRSPSHLLLLFSLFSLLWSSKQRRDKSRLRVSRRSTFLPPCTDEEEDDTHILLSAFVIISDAFYMSGDLFSDIILQTRDKLT